MRNYFLNWLKINPFLRFLWRTVVYSFSGVLLAGALMAAFSDLKSLRYGGLIFSAALIYGYWRSRKNSAWRILERAADRVLFTGSGDFYLNVLKILLEKNSIRKLLFAKQVTVSELESKLDEYIERAKEEAVSRAELFSRAENLHKEAREIAKKRGAEIMEAQDLYAVLRLLPEEKVGQLFKNFGII